MQNLIIIQGENVADLFVEFLMPAHHKYYRNTTCGMGILFLVKKTLEKQFL
jgi:hypothetical protein